ncbi:MAG: hypothetical protein AABX31_04385, partial [Nanoarchaeota archaeon]
LEKVYSKRFLEGVRERQEKRRLPFGGYLSIPELPIPINQDVLGRKWDRYGRYEDEISSTYTEIKYIENSIKTKKDELDTERAGLDLKKTFIYLAIFSFVGVFFPLFILTLSPEMMYSLRVLTLSAVLLGWIVLLGYLILEIKGLKKNNQLGQ